MSATATVTVNVLLDEERAKARLLEDARRGLLSRPKDLPPKWFYDDRGSELFEQITALPEYYQTRAEREILERVNAEIAELTKPVSLVELGSGAATKTRILLDALRPEGTEYFVPFDVCEEVVRSCAESISRDYGLSVRGMVGDFESHLHLIPRYGTQLIAFLGGTIGNLLPAERVGFLRTLRSIAEAGDHLLLGADLVKDPRRLVAAYDDSAGVTAAFNRNVLAVLNQQLGSSFDPKTFEHVAAWDAENQWIEMRLRSLINQHVDLGVLAGEAQFLAGEEMRTEVSAKFSLDGIADELATQGFDVIRSWTDRRAEFSLHLARAA
jgi:L-histidine N-alpha-methyltransferase